MKNIFFNQTSPETSTSFPQPEPTGQMPTKKRGGKKLYFTAAAALTIVIIVLAVLFVPQTNANVISLGVHYSTGEKLTYKITTALSSDSAGSSTNLSTDSTLTIEVISFGGDTYTLNYTSTSSVLGYSVSTSKLLEVKESQMVTTLALLPVAIQEFATAGNETGPLITAVFDQSQAKVGDTWNIPLNAADSNSESGNLTVTFKAIQDLTVPAGNYHVFRIDLSTDAQQSQSILGSNFNLELSGQSYLESGTCKQVQSTLQIAMSMSTQSSASYSVNVSITSVLQKDYKP